MVKTSPRMLLEEPRYKAVSTNAEVVRTGRHFAVYPPNPRAREQRIIEALGACNKSIPRVDQATLSAYYRYLSATLPLPFVAYFPAQTIRAKRQSFAVSS